MTQNSQDSVTNKPLYIFGQNLKDSLRENKHEIKLNNLIEKA